MRGARGEQLESQRHGPGTRGVREPAVAVMDLIETFLVDHRQRLLERQHQAHRRRERRLTERHALARLAQIEVEARQPAFDRGRGARPEAHGGDAGRHHQALLHAAHDHVHAPGVLRQRMDAETGHRVEHHAAPALAGDARQLLGVVQRSGRGLAMGREHRGEGRLAIEGTGQRLGLHRPPPLDVQGLVRHAVGGEQALPALAELAARDDQRALARRHQVDHRGLHGAGAGGGEQEHLARGAVELAQRRGDARQRGAKLVGAMVRRHLGERAQHARRDLDRAGSEETGAGQRAARALGARHAVALSARRAARAARLRRRGAAPASSPRAGRAADARAPPPAPDPWCRPG